MTNIIIAKPNKTTIVYKPRPKIISKIPPSLPLDSFDNVPAIKQKIKKGEYLITMSTIFKKTSFNESIKISI